MSDHCKNNQCSSSHHSHGHSHCCGDNHHGCCSSGCQCSCHKNECNHGNFADQLLQMADDAWMDLLKEKIKAKIESLSGKHLDKLADLVAKSNHKRWINKMASHEAKDDFEDDVADFFSKHK